MNIIQTVVQYVNRIGDLTVAKSRPAAFAAGLMSIKIFERWNFLSLFPNPS